MQNLFRQFDKFSYAGQNAMLLKSNIQCCLFFSKHSPIFNTCLALTISTIN